jgi:hypothetical protein
MKKNMKFNNILTWVDPRTKIRVTLNIYDMKFSTEHIANYYIELGNTNELLVRDVIRMRVIDDFLELELEN